jgi:Hint domain
LATYTWTVTSGTNNWSTPGDWNPLGPPASASDVVIGAGNEANFTVTEDTTVGIHSLTLNGFSSAESSALTLTSGATLTVGAGGITLNTFDNGVGAVIDGTGTLIDNGAISGSGGISASSGTLELSGTGSSTGVSLTINNSGATTLELALTGGVTSSSEVDLSSTNQTLELAAGTLTINQAEVLANGNMNMAGGTLDDASGLVVNSGSLFGFGTIDASTAISGTGGAVTASGGTLELAADLGNSLSQAISIAGASVLQLDGSAGTGNTFTYDAASGGLNYTLGSGGITDDIVGLNVGTTTSPTNFIDFTTQAGVFVTSTNEFEGNRGIVDLSNGSVLTMTGITGSTAGRYMVDTAGGGGGTEVFLSTVPVCYAAGTRILTATGERMVDSLQPGDIVLTLAGDELSAQPIKWVGRRRIDLTTHPRPETVAPIRVARGAVADRVPHSDLLVSPDHAILIDGKLICARQLINGTTIRQEMDATSIAYFHVELDAHAILLAEGLAAESYLDTGNRGFFANAGAPMVLHPDLTDEADHPARETASCAPFVWDADSVQPVWQRLAERAATLGQPAPRRDTTADPDLHIVAEGRALRPLYGENGLYVFALPKGMTEVRVVSRAGAPTGIQPWLEDRRCLGVHVARIVLRGAHEVQDVPVDHPVLFQGWWAAEQDGMALRRWTNGDAVVPLPSFEHPAILEIHASNSGMAYLTSADRDRRAA